MNLIWNRHTRSWILRFLQHLPIKNNRVICVCWGGRQFGCNPKAITDYIAEKYPSRFEVAYAFFAPDKFRQELPIGFQALEIGQLKYYYWLFTSHFIISNTRFTGDFFPDKRNGQLYIFTGHGGFGIKKVEFDAEKSLSQEYMKASEQDTQRIDLMLSGAIFRTKVIRSAYRYMGEVLEKGMPRNDVFFADQSSIGENEVHTKHYLIYTPTFRKNDRRDVYGFDPQKIVSALETRFGGEWYIRISSHPNMRSYYREIYDFSHPRLIDVGGEDLQPLLLTSDALITDYSSAEMDFSLLKRPIFQLCKDRQDYDRGFYLDPETLPFPYAETEEQLIHNILNFDNEKYLADLDRFNTEVIGLHETGHAAEAVVEWMLARL